MWSMVRGSSARMGGSSVVGELLAIEALGLAEANRGLAATQEGKTKINLSGGALPADPIMATGLVRLAVGIEGIDDILADLTEGFKAAK